MNNAVAAVIRQEALKQEYPPEKRLSYRVTSCPANRPPTVICERWPRPTNSWHRAPAGTGAPGTGQAGCFGIPKAAASPTHGVLRRKLRRQIPATSPFLLMTDRDDLDSQIYCTFVDRVVDDKHPTDPVLRR